MLQSVAKPPHGAYNCRMRSLRRMAIVLTLAGLIAGCGGRADTGNTSGDPGNASGRSTDAVAAQTNTEELRVFVNIPQEAEDTAWKAFPQERKLVAVMLFSKEDAQTLAQQIGSGGGVGTPVSIQVEPWFPVGLIAQADASGAGAVVGRSFAAGDLLLEPYNDGRIARVDGTDYFILEAFAR